MPDHESLPAVPAAADIRMRPKAAGIPDTYLRQAEKLIATQPRIAGVNLEMMLTRKQLDEVVQALNALSYTPDNPAYETLIREAKETIWGIIDNPDDFQHALAYLVASYSDAERNSVLAGILQEIGYTPTEK